VGALFDTPKHAMPDFSVSGIVFLKP